MLEDQEDRYKLFGEIALEKGYVTAIQLYEALTAQAKDHVDGKERLLGQVLIEMGFMSAEQVSEVLDILFPSNPSDPILHIEGEIIDPDPTEESRDTEEERDTELET